MRFAKISIFAILASMAVLLSASPSKALTISFDLTQQTTATNNDDAWWAAGKCAAINAANGIADTEVISAVELSALTVKYVIAANEAICFVGHGRSQSIGETTVYNGAAIAALLTGYVSALASTNELYFYSCNAGKALATQRNLIEATRDALAAPSGLKITGPTGACSSHPAAPSSPYLVSYDHAKTTGECSAAKIEERGTQAYTDAGVAADPCSAGTDTTLAGNTAFATCIYAYAPINTAMDDAVAKDYAAGCLYPEDARSSTVTIP